MRIIYYKYTTFYDTNIDTSLSLVSTLNLLQLGGCESAGLATAMRV
jgi:hypothetical protein